MMRSGVEMRIEYAFFGKHAMSKMPPVYSLTRPSRCHGCDKRLLPGDIVKLEESKDEREAFCRACARLDALEVLLSGNAKITRLATKYATSKYVVMKWSDMWKTYERVGIMVDSPAIDKAEAECGIKLQNRPSAK
jgi:hypothetical protein